MFEDVGASHCLANAVPLGLIINEAIADEVLGSHQGILFLIRFGTSGASSKLWSFSWMKPHPSGVPPRAATSIGSLGCAATFTSGSGAVFRIRIRGFIPIVLFLQFGIPSTLGFKACITALASSSVQLWTVALRSKLIFLPWGRLRNDE